MRRPGTRALAEQADIVVTMGRGDQCPYLPGKRYIDWELPRPSWPTHRHRPGGQDTISDRIADLIAALNEAD